MMARMAASLRITGVAAAAAALLLGSGVAAQAAQGHGAPVFRAAPRSGPAATRSAGSCSAAGVTAAGPSASDEKLMWVDGDPTSLTAVWLPGLNAKRCVARRTVSSAALAARVARAIEQAKPMPDEPLPCPFSDGTTVRLYFGYANGSTEYAEAALDGCRPISAPDRAARWGNTTRFEKTLLPAAPPAWRTYLGGGAPTAHFATAGVRRHGTPVNEVAPANAPLTKEHKGVCTVESPAPGGNVDTSKGLVWVYRNARRVVSVWLPSENTGHCVAVRKMDTASYADAIAAAIEHAPPMPRGIFCPRDDGSAVRIYLGYNSGVQQYANVELSGCHTVSAPGRAPREVTPALTRALRHIVPPGWDHYLRD